MASDLIESFMPSEEDFVGGFRDSGAVDGHDNPKNYLNDNEITGICEYGAATCVDAQGKEYINNNQDNEVIPPDGQPPKEVDFEPELDINPILSEPGTEEEPEVTDIVEIDPNVVDPDEFMNRCVKQESRRVIAIMGSTRPLGQETPPILSQAEAKAQAEKNLRLGICDKKVLGADYCRQWDLDRRTEEADEEPLMQRTLGEILTRSLKACPVDQTTSDNALNPPPCWKAKQNFLSRYVADPFWNIAVESAFDTLKRRLDTVIPIRFGEITVPKGVQEQVGAKPGFGKAVQIPIAGGSHQPAMPGLVIPDGIHVGLDARVTFKPPKVIAPKPPKLPTGERKVVVTGRLLPGQGGMRPVFTSKLISGD